MAYDIIGKKHTNRDWSCGATSAPSSAASTIGKGLVIGGLAVGGYLAWQAYKMKPPVAHVPQAKPGSKRMYMRMSPSGRMMMSTNPAAFLGTGMR